MHLPSLLSLLIFLPIVAGLFILFMSDDTDPTMERSVAAVVTVVNALVSLALLAGGGPGVGTTYQVAGFEEHFKWIPALGITYHLRSDGLSVFLIMLVAWLTPAAVIASWRLIQQRANVYYGCMLLLSGGMIGLLAAQDLFLFYVFWEIMLIPAFFLVGVFGGPRRAAATTKFVIYTMVGSLLMLVGIVYVGWQYWATHGVWSFNLDDLRGLTFSYQAGMWAFGTFVLAFGIKAALFPLHTWLPETYGQAPAPVTFMLSALMAKMGVYGLLRVAMPLFPDAAQAFSPVLVGLAVTGVVYAALVALVQEDAKQVLAYASVSHLGVILLGVFSLAPQALAGSVLHMVAHALTTGALFLLVGFLYERRGTTLIRDYGGAATLVPVFATVFMIVMLASVGLPGLTGFVGEFLIFLGAFRDHPTAAAIATLSIIFGACYMLWMYQRLMFGPLNAALTGKTQTSLVGGVAPIGGPRLPDLSMREGLLFVPLVALIIGIGAWPQPLLARIAPAVTDYLAVVAPGMDEANASPAAEHASPKGL